MDFQLVTSLPITLKPGAFERAIAQFVEDTHRDNVPIDKDGLFTQQVGYVYSCLVTRNNPNSHVWLAVDEDGEVGGYAFTNFEITVDNKPTLYMTTAWVRREHRFTALPKKWFHQMEDFGKAAGVKHLLIPSVRGSKGYLRYVGKDWHEYEVILKRDL